MAIKKSAKKKTVPLFEFKEAGKDFFDNEIYFRGNKLQGHFVKYGDTVTECRITGVDLSAFFDFDASELPDEISFDIKLSVPPTPYASDLILMTRHGEQIELLFECGFFNEQTHQAN